MAAVKGGKSYIASDTQGSNRFTKGEYKNNKIFKKDQMLVGGCGSYKQLQLFEHNFTLPDRVADSTPHEYMFEKFAPAIKKFFKDNNTISTKDAVDAMDNAEFILVYEGHLFVLQSDLALLEPKRDYVASGSGEYHAYAVMQALQKHDPQIGMKKMLQIAFEVTTDVVMSVGGELVIIEKQS